MQTRLRKLQEGECDATLLALAGLKRLDLADKATAILSTGTPSWAWAELGLPLCVDHPTGCLMPLNPDVWRVCHAQMRCCRQCPRAPLASPAATTTNGRVRGLSHIQTFCSYSLHLFSRRARTHLAPLFSSCRSRRSCRPEPRGDAAGGRLRACLPCGPGRLVPNPHCRLGTREPPTRTGSFPVVHALASLAVSACDHSAVGALPQNVDGQLAFRGLVSTPDGKKMYETSRTGALTGAIAWCTGCSLTACGTLTRAPCALCLAEEAARAIGSDAGAELKQRAQKDGTVFDW